MREGEIRSGSKAMLRTSRSSSPAAVPQEVTNIGMGLHHRVTAPSHLPLVLHGGGVPGGRSRLDQRDNPGGPLVHNGSSSHTRALPLGQPPGLHLREGAAQRQCCGLPMAKLLVLLAPSSCCWASRGEPGTRGPGWQ